MKLSINPSSKLSIIISEEQAAANIDTHDYLPIAATACVRAEECSVFINQLIRKYGTPPEGSSFFILENARAFNTPYSVAIFYQMDKIKAVNYANAARFGCDTWENTSCKQLQFPTSLLNNKQILQRA